MKFIVSKGLEHFSGGLLGRLMLAQLGYDGFVVNNEYSVLVSKDHCSVKSFTGQKIPNELIKKVAEYLEYSKYHTEEKDCLYIYNDNFEEKDNDTKNI